MDANQRGNTQTQPKVATGYIETTFPSYPPSSTEIQAAASVIALYNAALSQSGASVGRISRAEGSGNFRIGFQSVSPTGGSNDGDRTIYINTATCNALNRNIQGVLVEEMFYLLNRVWDASYPFGPRNGDDRTLSQRGANLTNYTYLMSPKNWIGTSALPPLSALLFGPVAPSGAAMDTKGW